MSNIGEKGSSLPCHSQESWTVIYVELITEQSLIHGNPKSRTCSDTGPRSYCHPGSWRTGSEVSSTNRELGPPQNSLKPLEMAQNWTSPGMRGWALRPASDLGRRQQSWGWGDFSSSSRTMRNVSLKVKVRSLGCIVGGAGGGHFCQADLSWIMRSACHGSEP